MRWNCAGQAAPDFAAILGLKDYPEATSPGLLDNLLRLPFEMVVSESYAPNERTTARERMDLALRRSRSVDEEAAAERDEMMAARDALGNGAVGFGDHHLTVLVRERSIWPARRCDGVLRGGAGGYRRDCGARRYQSRTRVLGAIPRQRGIYRAPRADILGQYGGFWLASTALRWGRPAATTGAKR